ncbi:hypothetical protein [Pseudomonas sp. VI4.1]|uniref:hypothetical protein n=1 Tax=Pseudomonas sp. VI4.1 TaxID=1941346 RepID=UPI00143CE415|nr:hypothetical protein [Pseudomonas sp. VI4.1]
MSAPTAGKAASLELTAPEKLKDIHQLSAFVAICSGTRLSERSQQPAKSGQPPS